MKNDRVCRECVKPADMSCNCKNSHKVYCYTHLAVHLQDNTIAHMVASLDVPGSATPSKARVQKLDKLKAKLIEYKEKVKTQANTIGTIERSCLRIISEELHQPRTKLNDLTVEIDHQIEQLDFFKVNFGVEAEKTIQKDKGNNLKNLLTNYDPLNSIDPADIVESFRVGLGTNKKTNRKGAGTTKVEELKGELKSTEKLISQFTKQIEKYEQTIRIKDEKILELSRKLKESEEVVYLNSNSLAKQQFNPNPPQLNQKPDLHFNTPQLGSQLISQSNSQVSSPAIPKSLSHSTSLYQNDSRQVAMLEGHTGPVMCCAASKDCKYLISGSWDTSIRIWDLKTFKSIGNLKGHTDHVLSVAITCDNKYIISGSDDSTIRIWNFETQQSEATLLGHTDWVNTVVLSKNDEFIVSASRDRSIRIWNMNLRIQIADLQGHTDAVMSVALSYDDMLIVSGSSDNTIRVWDFRSHSVVGILKGHRDAVLSVAVTPDKKYIISGSSDKSISIWNLVSLTQEIVLQGHTDYVRSVSVSTDNQYIISASRDSTVRVWNLKTRSLESTLEGHKDAVWCAVPSADNKYIFSGSGRLGFTAFFSNGDCTIRSWSFYS